MTPYPESIKIRGSYLVISMGLPNTWYLFPEHSEREIEVQIRKDHQGNRFIWTSLRVGYDAHKDLSRLLINGNEKPRTEKGFITKELIL